MTPIETILSVTAIGGRLGIAGDKLRMLLPADCSPELKDVIRANKSALLNLLRLNFWVVHSDTLHATVFWTSDEATRESLVAAGADGQSIFTRAELEQLVRSGVTPQELTLIHAARWRFNGRLAEP